MPSESYDFFAPLGEFGQPRRHYHQMRRLHNMVKGCEPHAQLWEPGLHSSQAYQQ